MLKSALLVVAVLAVFASAKTCKYDKSDFHSYWRFANNSILLHFQNTDIKNNEWTGIGFGEDKNNLVGVFFMVSNNQVAVRTGTTTEHGPPTLSQNGNGTQVSTQALAYFPEDETMSAAVQIPLQLNGRSLQNCQKWRFIKSGKIENGQLTRNKDSPKSKKVCPMECN